MLLQNFFGTGLGLKARLLIMIYVLPFIIQAINFRLLQSTNNNIKDGKTYL